MIAQRPMDVCLVSRILWPGGSQRILIAEAEELTRRGHRVDLVFVRATGTGTLTSSVPYRVLHGPESRGRPLGRLFRAITARYGPERGEDATVDADLLWRFERDRRKYDVVLYGDPWGAIFARGGAARHGDRYVVHVHETSFGVHDFHGHNLVPRWLEGRALRKASGVLTSSARNAEALVRSGFGEVSVLYPGVEPRERVHDFREREDLALSVTVWDPGRHPEVFLELAAALPIGRIVLAGQWTDPGALVRFRATIDQRGLQDRLEVTGAIPEDQLSALYDRAKVAIRFGYAEAGPGMGSLEALGRGIPLVINGGVGVRELLVPGASCLLVSERDAADFGRTLKLLFDDPAEWSKLSQGSLEVARAHSWAAHGERLEAILRTALRSPRSSPPGATAPEQRR